MDHLCHGIHYYRDYIHDRNCAAQKRTEKGETMGTIITCSFISLIAIASLIYFTIDDRKKAKGKKKGS